MKKKKNQFNSFNIQILYFYLIIYKIQIYLWQQNCKILLKMCPKKFLETMYLK